MTPLALAVRGLHGRRLLSTASASPARRRRPPPSGTYGRTTEKAVLTAVRERLSERASIHYLLQRLETELA